MADKYIEGLLGPPPTLDVEQNVPPLELSTTGAPPVGAIGMETNGQRSFYQNPNSLRVGSNPIPPTGLDEADYASRNTDRGSGVPFDPNEEMGHWLTLMTELRKDKEQKLRYLSDRLGPDNVRADDQGDPIVRVTDEKTGKVKDIPLNAHGMTVNDLMTVMSSLPQVLGSAAGLVGGRATPMVKGLTGAKGFLRDVTAGSIGGAIAKTGQDVATEAIDQQPIEFGNILKENAKQIPVSMMTDYGMAGAAKPISYLAKGLTGGGFQVASPLWKMRGGIQNDAIAAQQYIASKSGIEIPMTAGESSGIPFLAKLYEYVYRHPAGATPILKEREVKDAAKKAFQEYMIEPTTLKEDEVVGKGVVDLLNKMGDTAKAETENLAGSAIGTAKGAIGAIGSKIGGKIEQPSFSNVGGTVREKIISLRDAAKAEQSKMREGISAMPGGSGKIFDSETLNLTGAAKQQLKKLPAPEKTITEETGLVDLYGKPASVTKTGSVIEKEFVPDRVVARLKSLTEQKKYSLSDLIQMRSDVYEDIAAGQAVPNTGTHYLSEIGNMLTGAIKQGVDQLPSGDLKTALVAANKHYQEKVIPFNTSGISRLFKESTDPGFLENTDVVKGIVHDGDKYLRTVDFLGKGSPEHTQLKRAVFDQLISESSNDLEGKMVNGSALARNLKQMATDQKTKAVFQDVFGKQGESLMTQGALLDAAEGLANRSIPAAQVEKMFGGGTKAYMPLQAAAAAAKKEADFYKNRIVKALATGDIDPSKIKAGDFIDKFLESGDKSEVAQVWGHLSSDPQLQDQIKRKLIERVFANAQRSVEPSDIAAKLRGDQTHVVSSSGLMRSLGGRENQEKLNLIIGKDKMELLKASTSMQAAEDWAKAEAGETGIFASGNAVGGIMRMKPLSGGLTKEAVDFAKYKIVATLMSSSGFNRMLASSYTPKEIPWLVKAIVVSQPFIDAVIEDSGNNTKAYQILSAAKSLAGLSVSRPSQTQQQPQNNSTNSILGPRP